MRAAAFFDLDKTIIAKSSMLSFARPLSKAGLLSRTALMKAGSVETDALLAAMEGLEVPTSPTGPFMFRAADHQSTMGAYVGLTAREDGMGYMTDWSYADGADYLPSEEEAAKLRPAE